EVPYIRGIMGDNISQRIKRRDNVMNLIFNGIKIK
ncbi:MAG: TetR family transcriptional regulator, partial [Parabacteroides distasonis]|nr:TetR family transcriptional regulator [Parabacteroides distasonis]